MIPTLYRGSVKDLLGPVRVMSAPALIFDYTDAYSVFDWGRMPDFLTGKGDALATLAADIFEKLENPAIWREFSKSPGALSLRKANRFGSVFNELGEDLQSSGLRTHYIGFLDNLDSEPKKISDARSPFRKLAVKQVSVSKPQMVSILGRSVPDYQPTRQCPYPRLIPLEIVFRFGCAEKSSILERISSDSSYLASLGFPEYRARVGEKWDFPVLELFTKLETTDRHVPLSEALAISGLSSSQLQEVLLKTAWVAGLLRYWCSRLGLDLVDGKLEWAVSDSGKCFLVDAIGPDELRIMKNGIQLSKEFLRGFYRNSFWYTSVEKAKLQAKSQGTAEWKRLVHGQPPALPPAIRELGIQLYMSLTNELTEKKWFAEAWGLEKVIHELSVLHQKGQA